MNHTHKAQEPIDNVEVVGQRLNQALINTSVVMKPDGVGGVVITFANLSIDVTDMAKPPSIAAVLQWCSEAEEPSFHHVKDIRYTQSSRHLEVEIRVDPS